MNVIATTPLHAPLRTWLLAAFLATLGGIVTGSAYFAVGGIFALISDLFALAMGVVGVAVVIGLHAHVAAVTGRDVAGVRALGLLAYGLTIVGSIGLVLLNAGIESIAGPAWLGLQFAGMAAQGAWLVGFGVLVLRVGAFPRSLGWTAVAAGVGFLSFGGAAVIAPGSVVAMSGGFVGVVVYLVLVMRLRAAVGRA